MNNPNINKISFDGVNLLTSTGIQKMCQNTNEFDSFYTHSVLNNLAGVMKHSKLFFMNASERVYLLERILEHEGILDHCLQGSRSRRQQTVLRPPYAEYLASKLNRIFPPTTPYFEKRESFFGLFCITSDEKLKYDNGITTYRLQATDLSYMAGKKVSNEFYCRIESAFLESVSNRHGLAPKSIMTYEGINTQQDNLFFLEDDVLTFFKIENVAYQEIDTDLHYQDGKLITGEKGKSSVDSAESHSTEKTISREELLLLTLLSAIVNEALRNQNPRFKTINQLYNYPREKYPELKGISESTVRSKIKEAENLMSNSSITVSNTAINTRTERTLYKIIAVLLKSILTSIHSSYKNEEAFITHLFDQKKLKATNEVTPQHLTQLASDIMKDFKVPETAA